MLKKPEMAEVECRPMLPLGPEARLRHVPEEIPVQRPLRWEVPRPIGPVADWRRRRIEREMGPARDGHDRDRAEQKRQPQPATAIAEEGGCALAIQCARREAAGEEEEDPHEKGRIDA